MGVQEKTPFSQALADYHIAARVKDVDHYRIHGGMAVETDYIIFVEYKRSADVDEAISPFEPFTLSKTYSHFRTFAKQLKTIADGVMSSKARKSFTAAESTKKLGRYCETVHHVTETQRHQYVGKVNYKYVKSLAKKRSQIIQEILDATLSNFPRDAEESQFARDVAHAIETLFLTDHCVEIGDGHQPSDDVKNYYQQEIGKIVNRGSTSSKLKLPSIMEKLASTAASLSESFKGTVTAAPEPSQRNSTRHDVPPATPSTPVVPITRKRRNSLLVRQADLNELEKVGEDANLMLDDERPQSELLPSYSAPIPTYSSRGSRIGKLFETNPLVFGAMTLVLLVVLRRAGTMAVTMDLDVLMLFIWAAFCIGLNSPRPMIYGIDERFGPPSKRSPKSPSPSRRRANDLHGRKLLRRMSMQSMHEAKKNGDTLNLLGAASDRETDDDVASEILDEIQSPLPVFPKGAAFGSHLNCWSQPGCSDFYVRGANYLKDRVKVESGDFLWQVRGIDLFLTDTPPENAGRLAGIMGGRLREVPTFIINFRLPWGVLLAYFEIPDMYIPFIKAGHDPHFDKLTLPPTNSMTPGQRCTARYCQSSPKEKDELLKIIPGVADGPWVVKSVVGNKPAILGTKMPVNYIYEKEDEGKAMYLEMDLDIVASSAARGILSMVRTYTNVITLDLGFVVQGNQEDELPEQMLAAARLHGLDPLNAPALPVSQADFLSKLESAAHDDDDTES